MKSSLELTIYINLNRPDKFIGHVDKHKVFRYNGIPNSVLKSKLDGSKRFMIASYFYYEEGNTAISCQLISIPKDPVVTFLYVVMVKRRLVDDPCLNQWVIKGSM